MAQSLSGPQIDLTESETTMTNTSHGHHILGTQLEVWYEETIVRCGGPMRCNMCALEANMLLSSRGMTFALYYPETNLKENTQVETPAVTKPSLDIKKFMRRTFDVDAVLVTEENFEAVAEWCGGKIVTITPTAQSHLPGLEDLQEQRHISVEVSRPLNRRQTEAYVGDWILYANKGFKVYTNRPFQKNFVERSEGLQELFVTKEQVGMLSDQKR